PHSILHSFPTRRSSDLNDYPKDLIPQGRNDRCHGLLIQDAELFTRLIPQELDVWRILSHSTERGFIITDTNNPELGFLVMAEQWDQGLEAFDFLQTPNEKKIRGLAPRTQGCDLTALPP